MTIMSDAKLFGGVGQDDNTYVSVTVTNRGDAPTTITHMVVYGYSNKLAVLVPRRLTRWRWMKQLRPKIFIIPKTGTPGPLPYLLEPGTYWVGMATHTPELNRWIEAGRCYVGII